jgi:hypothetical protein
MSTNPTQLPANIAGALANISLPMTGDAPKEPKMQTCEVGMFRLPGLIVDYNQYTAEEVAEMEEWGRANGGKKHTDKLWSFRKESKRDWFILRWT